MKTGMLLFISFLLVRPSWGSLEPNQSFTVKKLRVYCSGCHAVDDLRFIKSQDDEEVWKTILNEKSTKSQEVWVKLIYKTLDWPSLEPPPSNEPLSPTNDWMPKGYKRLLLSEDYTGKVQSRLIILETLKAAIDDY